MLWLVASALFAVYIANFSHYNKVYGSLAGVIIFLIWMWISNVAILLGAELTAELERGRAVAGGHPADKEPFAELRDDRKLRKKVKKEEKQAEQAEYVKKNSTRRWPKPRRERCRWRPRAESDRSCCGTSARRARSA